MQQDVLSCPVWYRVSLGVGESVSLSVCHKSVFYRNGTTDPASLCMGPSSTYPTLFYEEIHVFPKIRVQVQQDVLAVVRDATKPNQVRPVDGRRELARGRTTHGLRWVWFESGRVGLTR